MFWVSCYSVFGNQPLHSFPFAFHVFLLLMAKRGKKTFIWQKQPLFVFTVQKACLKGNKFFTSKTCCVFTLFNTFPLTQFEMRAEKSVMVRFARVPEEKNSCRKDWERKQFDLVTSASWFYFHVKLDAAGFVLLAAFRSYCFLLICSHSPGPTWCKLLPLWSWLATFYEGCESVAISDWFLGIGDGIHSRNRDPENFPVLNRISNVVHDGTGIRSTI